MSDVSMHECPLIMRELPWQLVLLCRNLMALCCQQIGRTLARRRQTALLPLAWRQRSKLAVLGCTVRLMSACNKPLPVLYVAALTLVHPNLGTTAVRAVGNILYAQLAGMARTKCSTNFELTHAEMVKERKKNLCR